MDTHAFALTLKEIREARGFTQYGLAKECGFSASCISRLESANRRPLPETIDTLVDVLKPSNSERFRLYFAARHMPPDFDNILDSIIEMQDGIIALAKVARHVEGAFTEAVHKDATTRT